MPIKENILISQKFNNYNYAPGIATYGIDGKTGETGTDGNNIYFTDFDFKNIEDLKLFASQLIQNYLPLKNSTIKINRSYKNNDLFFNQLGIIYKLNNIDKLLNNIESITGWNKYFSIAGRLSIANDSSLFTFLDNRLVLNSSFYGGYDIVVGSNPSDVSNLINKNSAVNIISNKVDENNNIEMIRIQSIDDVDIEDGKLSIYYKTTENAFYLDSNKPIVIDGDVKLNNDNNINNEYDNYSTILTSNDTITYFKHICDKLEYSIIYDNEKNQYIIAIYSLEDSIAKQCQALQYIYDRNETVFGKIYTGLNEKETNDIVLVKLNQNFNDEPYLYSYIPTKIQSITAFSLIYNVEVFLKFNSRNNIELDDIDYDYSKYSSIKLMRYNPFYYAFFNDPSVLILDEQNYYEYTGETVTYNGSLCYVWNKHIHYSSGSNIILLTNSLHLTLPFKQDSNEFVAIINKDSYEDNYYEDILEIDDNINLNSIPTYVELEDGSEKQTYYNTNTKEFKKPIPDKYIGLCILRKTL